MRDASPTAADAAPAGGTLRRPGTWLALAAYAVAVVALTWPLAPRATTHIAATYGRFHIDTLHTTWMLAHESRALTEPATSLLDAGIYHPERRTLFYSTMSLGLLPYFAPAFLATGNPVLAIDLAFLACVALTAWTMHMVVWRWTGGHLAAAFAALTYLCSSTPVFGFPSAAPYFAAVLYLPLIIYAAATPASRLAAPAVLALLIALQSAAEPLYLAPFVLVPLGAIALARLVRASSRRDGVRLATAIALAAVVLLPIYAGYLDVLAKNPRVAQQSVWGNRNPASIAGGTTPSLAFDVYAYVVGSWYWYPIPLLALAIIVAGFTAARRRPAPRAAWMHCAVWSVLIYLLPLLRSGVPMLRGLHRGRILGLVSLGMLTGLAAAASIGWIATRYGRRAGALAAAVMLVALVACPNGTGPPAWLGRVGSYPTQPAPDPASPLVTTLRGGAGPVLELPCGRPEWDAYAVYRTIFHRRPLVNGYSSYYPSTAAARQKLARRLPDPLALGLLRAETGLTTLVVRADELDAASRRAWAPVLANPKARTDLRLVAEHAGVRVFDVVPIRSVAPPPS